MSMFAIVTKPPRLQSQEAPKAGLLFACIAIVFAVGQLVSFEKFIPLLEEFGLPGGHGTAVLVACTLVTAEVLALPFLLRMQVSLLMRWFGMVCMWIVAIIWTILAFWMNLSTEGVSNAGFLGASLELPVGWWSVSFGLALVVLAGWISWGMWPGPLRKAVK